MKLEEKDVELLVNGCDKLKEFIVEDYIAWSNLSSRYDGDSDSRRNIRDEMILEFEYNTHYYKGSKYVKFVVKNSVWGFVVAIHDDKKFRFGDILKPAGWKAPARNFARGNVIDKNFGRTGWSGAI